MNANKVVKDKMQRYRIGSYLPPKAKGQCTAQRNRKSQDKRKDKN